MRIALVSPKWNNMINSYPPLGLGYLAAVMEREGHEVAIYDLGLDPEREMARDVAEVVAFEPNLIGVTAMTNNYHSAEQLIALLKKQIGCPIVLGGPHATLFPQRLVADPHIDYVIYGEGEETLTDLVRTLDAHNGQPPPDALSGIEGLCYSRKDEAICNPPRALIRDLDTLPFPARHLYDIERYPLYAPNGEQMVTLMSSRGCPFNCSYCFKGIVGRTYRQRSPENVIGEIRHLIDTYGFRDFYFIDDLFTMDPKRVLAITSLMSDEQLGIRWQCLARVDRVTREVLEAMHRAGCREVHFGIESGNPEILKRIDKGITLEQVRRAVAWAAEVGILVKGYFMLGLPGDTEETMRQTIDFASELELDVAMFSLTTPFPGTRLWDDLVAQQPDVAFDKDFSQAFYYNNYDQMIEPFFNLSEVSDATLSQLAFEAQTRFQESKRRRKYERAMGKGMGRLLYAISNVKLLRQVGHAMLRGDWVRRLPGLRQLGDHYLSEGTRQWS